MQTTTPSPNLEGKLAALEASVGVAGLASDASRCCSKGHQLVWLSTVGSCDSCPQTFVALMTDGVKCFRCGNGFVRRVECRDDEPREFGGSINLPELRSVEQS